MLILGIDDAGRGPLIGPMFLAGVLVEKDKEKELKEIGAEDSKTLTHPTRIRLSKEIMQRVVGFHVERTDANDIDSSILSGTNLNTLEAKKAANIINTLTKGKKDTILVIVDCPSVNTQAWRKTLMSFVQTDADIEVVCEHKADANYPSVSAASILAKVAREDSVTELKKKFGDFGSGYPSDPYTKEFLKKQGSALKDSGLFRKTWATWKAVFPDSEQQTL
ncbi:MAG TPA: ribonuclease HII [Candidatus Nanoarchaeia archaeon]|nr:ribonuclease HII [Candidatus Nanoarchaeia archaeon]